jgi:hypothetical protein
MENSVRRHNKREAYQMIRSACLNKRNIGIALVIILGLFLAVIGRITYAHFFAKVEPIIDVDKQAKINDFMEKNTDVSANEPLYINGVLHYEAPRVYCENTYYGQRGNYAYAIVFCAEYSWGYRYNEVASFYDDGRVIEDEHRPIKITREIHRGRSSTLETRLLIAAGDDFVILGFDQIDEPIYTIPQRAREIFPLDVDLNKGKQSFGCESKQRFYDDNKNVPKPTHISEIYGQQNPTIVYGVDDIELCR